MATYYLDSVDHHKKHKVTALVLDGNVQTIEIAAGAAVYSDPAVRMVRLRCATASFEYSFVAAFVAGTGCVIPTGDATCVFLVDRSMCLAADHATADNFKVYVRGSGQHVMSICVEPFNPPAGW